MRRLSQILFFFFCHREVKVTDSNCRIADRGVLLQAEFGRPSRPVSLPCLSLSLWVSQSLLIWSTGCSTRFIPWFLSMSIQFHLKPRGFYAVELKNNLAAEMEDMDFKWNPFYILHVCQHVIRYTLNHKPTVINLLHHLQCPFFLYFSVCFSLIPLNKIKVQRPAFRSHLIAECI